MLSVQKTKAAILEKINRPLILDEVELPQELSLGQVLVQLKFSGICGSQIGEINGVKGEDKYLPHLLGHEGSGIVIETGPEVNFVKPLDHVVLHWKSGQGIQSAPPSYRWRGQKLNAGWVTTFNEYAIVSENRLTSIPRDFDLLLAPLFGCAVTTGLGVITNNAMLKIGQSIVVFGAGGVGLSVIQGADLVSACPIIAVDLFDNRLKMAAQMGATHLINSSKMDTEEEIMKILGRQGADVIVDNTGNPSIISLAYELTHPRGKTILVGVPQKDNNISIYSLPLHFGKTITGSHGGETQPTIDIPRYIRLYHSGKLKLDNLITNRFPLTKINTAITKMQTGEIAGRCMLEMNPA